MAKTKHNNKNKIQDGDFIFLQIEYKLDKEQQENEVVVIKSRDFNSVMSVFYKQFDKAEIVNITGLAPKDIKREEYKIKKV